MTKNVERMAELRRRLMTAGATVSTAASTQRLYLTAWLPPDTDPNLVAELKRDGWSVLPTAASNGRGG